MAPWRTSAPTASRRRRSATESILHSATFAILAAFAVNTVMYGAPALGKLLPKVYVADWVSPRNQRSETRSIYPDLEPARLATPEEATGEVLDPVA